MCALVQQWFELALVDAIAVTRECIKRGAAICIEGQIYDIGHLAGIELSKSMQPTRIVEWGAGHKLTPTQVKEHIRSISSDKVFVYTCNKTQYGRRTTAICAHDKKTLAARLKKRGVKGTKLEDIYKEYENAYLDVFDTSFAVIYEGLVWHRDAAISE